MKLNAQSQADMIARRWIKYADKTISEGGNPAKLSDYPEEYFGQIQDTIGSLAPSWAKIKKLAIVAARQILISETRAFGTWTKVIAFFGKKKAQAPKKIVGQTLVLNYGMGVDSTAMIVGLVERGIRPDIILFADTGSEKPETYAYLATISEFLARHDFPKVTVVDASQGRRKFYPAYTTIEGNCLSNATLPSIVFGGSKNNGKCSLKWKAQPMDRFLKDHEHTNATWKAGMKIVKLLGYDCGVHDSKRGNDDEKNETETISFVYPLQAWGWDRERCMVEIEKAGLPIPSKSACFMCPSSKPWEIRNLTPDQLRRTVRIEKRAASGLKTIKGLWRNGTKGTRGGIRKPGRMTDFILQEGLLSPVEIFMIWSLTPDTKVELKNATDAEKALLDDRLGDDFIRRIAAPEVEAIEGDEIDIIELARN